MTDLVKGSNDQPIGLVHFELSFSRARAMVRGRVVAGELTLEVNVGDGHEKSTKGIVC
jgi:hypothetical protein